MIRQMIHDDVDIDMFDHDDDPNDVQQVFDKQWNNVRE